MSIFLAFLVGPKITMDFTTDDIQSAMKYKISMTWKSLLNGSELQLFLLKKENSNHPSFLGRWGTKLTPAESTELNVAPRLFLVNGSQYHSPPT